MMFHCDACEALVRLVDTTTEPPRPLTWAEVVAEDLPMGCPSCPTGTLWPALPPPGLSRSADR